MKKPKKVGRKAVWTGLLVALIVVAVFTIGVTAASSASTKVTAVPTAGQVATHAVPMALSQSAGEYWTPARMAAARPADAVATKVAVKPTSTATTAATGLPSVNPGQPPSGETGPTGPANPIGPSGASTQTQCYQCAIPFTRYDYFARYRSYPVSTVAKIFFTNNGGNYVCSGSVIGDHTVWTAGHCTANTDGAHQFDSSMLVCPSYNAGVNPAVGCWSATSFVTTSAWLNTGSFENDMGAAVMSNCGTVHCQSIGSYTGHLGFAWNWGEDQNWYAFGYPQAAPFDGNYLVLSNSEFGYEDSEGNNQGAPNSIAMGSDQTGGSSGGPWIWQFGTAEYVNGHNDWKWNNLPNAMNSPYFNSQACNVAVAASAFTATC